ncbi:MAG: hydrogenase iron-sulfur subunit [Thermodesulfatator sp.]|nr:MAG: hydrogenase iron-sulfur subunit [Thermodesulfatator sp.]
MARILVFSTDTISDPGIDFAGMSHLSYPSTVDVVMVPCSSGIHPDWLVRALEKGYEGVFVAADGEDCPYLADCTHRTAEIVRRAQEILQERGGDPRRIRMAAICSVCGEAFVNHIRQFAKILEELKGA